MSTSRDCDVFPLRRRTPAYNQTLVEDNLIPATSPSNGHGCHSSVRRSSEVLVHDVNVSSSLLRRRRRRRTSSWSHELQRLWSRILLMFQSRLVWWFVIAGTIVLVSFSLTVPSTLSTDRQHLKRQTRRHAGFSLTHPLVAVQFPHVPSLKQNGSFVTTNWNDFYGTFDFDYGNLVFQSLNLPHNFHRDIHKDAESWYENARQAQFDEMDESNDDPEHYDELDFDATTQQSCHRLKWAGDMQPNCNMFHELTLAREPDIAQGLQSHKRRYLAHGQYRDSWLFEPLYSVDDEPFDNFVLKALRFVEDIDYSWWLGTNVAHEALIMERTSSFPQTMNIYGYCFASIFVEHGFEISQKIVEGVEYDGRGRIQAEILARLQQDDVYPFNNFTKEEKLNIAIQMAEGIAIMHGHEEGVIVNDDVHPDQWLVNKNGLVKFNDFNNAKILDWNADKQEYCKFDIWIGGDYRSPEEEKGLLVDEKSDIWPLGANIMGLLSGLFPYYTEWNRWTLEDVIASGERPFLDPRYKTRSLIEGRLYDIMQQCWEELPENRVSIFEVVQFLYETRQMLERAKELKEWIPERDDVRPQQKSLLVVREEFDREKLHDDATAE